MGQRALPTQGTSLPPAASSTPNPEPCYLGQQESTMKGPLLPCPMHLQKVQEQKKVCKFWEDEGNQGRRLLLTQSILSTLLCQP